MGLDAVERVNGVLACGDCGALLCVQEKGEHGVVREGDPPRVVEQIAVALQPNPYPDIDRVLCAGCGTVLFERDGDT